MASMRVTNTLVVCDGQSLNITPGGANGYPYLCTQGFKNTAATRGAVVSIGGTAWSTLTVTAALRCYRHAHAATNTILVMNGGTSDYLNGDSGATVYATIKAYALGATAAGFDSIVVCTTTPESGFSGPQDTARKAGNDLVIGNADGAFTAVVDLASDSSLSNPGGPHTGTTWYGTGNLSNPANATYYTDGLHWTNAGAADAATSTRPALSALGAT